MDVDDLQDEVNEWVRDGIISDQQAEEIVNRYDPDESRRSRVVLALSLVGAMLILVGVTWFLATNWEDLPTVVRTVILIAAPSFAYIGGYVAYGRKARQIGLAFCLLGAILVGPSLFLFDDLFSLEFATEWLLFGWTAAALPTGHALGSRVGTGIGLVILVALVIEVVEPGDPIPVVGLFGIVLVAIGYFQVNRVSWTYRIVGVILTLGALLVLTTLEGEFHRFDPKVTPALIAGLIGAIGGIGWLYYTGLRAESGWALLCIVALGGSVGVAIIAPDVIPNFAAFLGTHMAVLIALFATGYLGYRTRSRSFIDLATIGGLLQTLSFVAATVVGALSGSIALVIAGLVLLAVGVALERGRRTILAQL